MLIPHQHMREAQKSKEIQIIIGHGPTTPDAASFYKQTAPTRLVSSTPPKACGHVLILKDGCQSFIVKIIVIAMPSFPIVGV